MRDGGELGRRAGRWGRRLLYWACVTVTSLALVVGLLLLMESCDEATIAGSG